MRAYGKTNLGSVRANNEDAFLVDEGKGLLIVADGMGGHAGGEEASQTAIEAVTDSLGCQFMAQPEQSILNAIMAANRVVLTKSASDPNLSGMGTTLTIAVLLPDFLITGHVGDSKAFIITKESIRCLTSEHSVSGQLLAAGKITEDEAISHPQRHVLTRALGTGADLQAEVLRHPYSHGHYILLCSDGLTEVVKPEEIPQVVNGPGTLEQKVDILIQTVLDRGAPDNVTIILAQL